ncbi:hypothetical protein C4D60_Mb11t10640 [Musa balbisiana]|uniref:ATP synthase protein MI25 n=1 Tax=Musa balbisiana TaxID=52838 RepID=A0A4S8J366_MUSBA|nr:hypothetical protein C4D60_Mb11t10640 [Musa balbisiana]
MNPLALVPHHEVIQPLVNDVLVAVIQNNVKGLVFRFLVRTPHWTKFWLLPIGEWDSNYPGGKTPRCLEFLESGILLNRQNIPIMSMLIKSMLLAINLNFFVFSFSLDDMMGQSFASLVPTVAVTESAIGSAIFVMTFQVRGSIAVESINCKQERWIHTTPCLMRFCSKDMQDALIFNRNSLGNTFKATLDGRMESIQEELLQFYNPNEVIPEESNEQQRLLMSHPLNLILIQENYNIISFEAYFVRTIEERISLLIYGTVVESLPMARCVPKCEKTVQALLC